jgi:prepilin-type N-terminal cleavage/methylation domain-containing protein
MFKKTPCNQKGFTLVEVIVVAVIVAILAAVAIPLYLGYVTDSRVNQCENAAGSAASFCGACKNSGGTVAAAAYAPGATITCPANTTTMSVPANITITVTANTVSAKHAKGEQSADTYKF